MKRWIGFAVLSLLVCLTLTQCAATSNITKELPQTLQSSCRVYGQAKPQVMEFRQWAIDHWDKIPADVRDKLQRLDAFLPELDRAGTLICAAAAILPGETPAKVDWDKLLSTVIRGAGMVLDAKAHGVIP
jgi:hypothetical protein